MSVEQFIIQYLAENAEAKVPHFGVFTLKNTEAAFDEGTKIFSPPAQQVCFHPDYGIEDEQIIKAFAAHNSLERSVAQAFFSEKIAFWKTKLYNGETLVIEKLGRFIRVGDEIILQGEKLMKENPNFYGLENIHLGSLAQKKRRTNRFTIIWILIALILLLVLFGIIRPDLFF